MSVRLMSFNTMLLPPIIETARVDPTKLVWGEGETRARAIGAAVAGDPWADVVGFVEVWSDVGRLAAGATLTREILAAAAAAAGYQFVTPRVPDPIDVGSGKFADSGLLLVAKHQPVPLPQQLPSAYATQDGRVGFVQFSSSSGDDALVSKGALLVRFETSHGYVTVALTHLQASYDVVDQHAADRASQLAQVEALIEAALGPRPWSPHEHVVIMGDLNVGAIGSTEYDRVFASSGSLVSTHFQDGWSTFMPRADPGVTQHAWDNKHPQAELQRNRLDYHLLYDPRPPAPPTSFVVGTGGQMVPKLAFQHMRIVHRTLSDHFALRGDLNEWRTGSSPAYAEAIDEAEKNGYRRVTLERAGQMMWLRFRPGPYTFSRLPAVDLSVYLESNISDAWAPYREGVDLSRIQGAEGAWQDRGLPPVGTLFSAPEPFYVRLVAPDGYEGQLAVGWHRHGGTSIDDAIPLFAQAPPRRTDFPEGQPLNDRDEQWFSAKIGRALSSAVHNSLFYVDNHTGAPISLSIRSASGHELSAPPPSAGSRLEVTWADQGDEGGKTFYVVVSRGSTEQTSTAVGWRTALTYLWPLQLRCEDETGVDFLGADEITVQLAGDGYDAGRRDNDDMDTGESMLFDDAPGSSARWLPFAFLEDAEVRVTEHDLDGDVDGVGHIEPLTAGVAGGEEQVGMDVGSGHYAFFYRRTHSRPGD